MGTARRTPQGVLWVCQACLFAAVNGDMPTGPCGCPTPHLPWQREPDTDVTAGLSCDIPDHFHVDPEAHTLECETRDFSWSPCDGCGCPLSGSRHAFTWWADPASA